MNTTHYPALVDRKSRRHKWPSFGRVGRTAKSGLVRPCVLGGGHRTTEGGQGEDQNGKANV